jgi:pimeloyl-ACP methyl ester carboxylesterase
VAFKGTSLKRDMVEDFKLGVGMNTTHYALATAFTSSLPISKGAKVSVCGHSLGGAIAQIVGNRNQLPFVTFNAPGVALISRNVGEVARTVMTGGAAIRTAGTVLSAVRHPVQAYQDTVAVFHKTVGANLRLEGELVSKIGVHYGRVIDVPVPDSSLGVYDLHLMKNVLEALSLSQYRDKPLEQLIG